MRHQWNHFTLTRRGVLTLAAGAGVASWTRLYAANPDFWNKKEPSEWTSQEIDELTAKSPWAKEVTAQYAPQANGQYGRGGQGGGTTRQGGGWGSPGGGGGIPGVGIPGIGGMGGGGMGGGRRNGGQPVETARGTVRWESSKTILAALKTAIPDVFSNHYVISVNGLPLDPGSRRRYQDDPESRSQSTEDLLDRLKSMTTLEPKGRRDAQAGVVQQPKGAGYGSIWFGFSKDLLNLKPEDKEVTFTTQFGRVPIRAKFVLKDMMYHGELAV